MVDRLREVSRLKVKVYTMQDFHTKGHLDSHGSLWIDGQEVSVAYFRTGYVPQNYSEEGSFEGRLMIEKSAAIKCPNIDLQLVTFKKV